MSELIAKSFGRAESLWFGSLFVCTVLVTFFRWVLNFVSFGVQSQSQNLEDCATSNCGVFETRNNKYRGPMKIASLENYRVYGLQSCTYALTPTAKLEI